MSRLIKYVSILAILVHQNRAVTNTGHEAEQFLELDHRQLSPACVLSEVGSAVRASRCKQEHFILAANWDSLSIESAMQLPYHENDCGSGVLPFFGQ